MWHQTYPNIHRLIGKDHWALDQKDFYKSRVEEWINFYVLNGTFPPGQVTKEGMMVDGHHRLAAARSVGKGLWCVIVKPDNGWVTTGEVALVK